MVPLDRRMLAAEPIPNVFKPREPETTVMMPVKVLFADGLRTQTPPSDFVTERTPAPPPTSLVSTEVTILKSLLTPRNSRVLAWAATFGELVRSVLFRMLVRMSGPEPSAEMRRVPVEPVR